MDIVYCLDSLNSVRVCENAYGYYMLLRTAICLTAAYGFSKALDLRRSFWLWVYGSVAVLSNPILPVRAGVSEWLAWRFGITHRSNQGS